MALLVGCRTCNLQVVGLSPGRAPLCSDLGQATYTCVPQSPSSNLVLVNGADLFGYASNHGPGGK